MFPGQTALILFSHGSRDPEWANPLIEICRGLVARQPAFLVELAFLELMKPSLDDLVAKLYSKRISKIIIAPMFLAQGGHLKEDLPRLVRQVEQNYPAIQFSTLLALGESPTIQHAIVDWLMNSILAENE